MNCPINILNSNIYIEFDSSINFCSLVHIRQNLRFRKRYNSGNLHKTIVKKMIILNMLQVKAVKAGPLWLHCLPPARPPAGRQPRSTGRSRAALGRRGEGQSESPFLFNNGWLLTDVQDRRVSCVGELTCETRRSPLGTII